MARCQIKSSWPQSKLLQFLGASCNRFTAASKCRDAAKIYPTSVLSPQFRFFVRDEHKWAASWENQQNDCAPSKDSDQPGYLSSRGQWRLWSNWVDAQADLSIRWAQSSFCWFSHEAAQINASIRSSYLPDIIWKQPFFSIDFSIEHTGSIQIHSTFWIFKMSSAIDSPCSGNKKLVFKIKVWQSLRE